MKDLVKLSKEDITKRVIEDLKGRDEDNVENLKKFYFKILIEEELRTSSFRYLYARVAFEIICEHTSDKDSLDNFNKYHKQKINNEIANPNITQTIIERPKKPLSDEARKFLGAVKTTQFKI